VRDIVTNMENLRNPPRITAKTSAPDAVREKLRLVIISGELPPGMQLKQDELAERYGTSRIPVREALRQLEVEGYVVIHPNRGAVVADLSLDEILELLEVRIALETHALRIAVPQMGDIDLDTARAILRAYDAESDPEKWSEMNWTFHRTLYAPCNRPKLLAMIETNYGHVGRFTRGMVLPTVGKERSQREHYAILAACQKGDAGRAARLLGEHIAQTQKSLMAAARHRHRDRKAAMR
jgi:DNA-binding GntR family transcriptional regulator